MTKTCTRPLVAGLDGDVLVYRAAFKAQYNLHTLRASDGSVLKTSQKKRELKEWQELTDDETTITTEMIYKGPGIATKAFDDAVKTTLNKTKANKVVVYLSGLDNFRVDLATIKVYKGNRVGPRPLAYEEVRQHIKDKYDTIISSYCEADDLLATALYKEYNISKLSKNQDDCRFICCTIDKDLRTVPGRHYNFTSKKLDWVNSLEAYRFFYTQMLTGDAVDNIPGIKGIGPKTAKLLLEGIARPLALESTVLGVYKVKHKSSWLNRFLEVGRLLHMQRYPGELWRPLYASRSSS